MSWRSKGALEGALTEVMVRPDSNAPTPDSVTGELAREPLHFELYAHRLFWALIPVPLGSPDSLAVALVVRRDDLSDTVPARLHVRSRPERTQALSLPPPFDHPPDSAAVERLAAEAALLDTVRERARELPRLWHEPFLRPVPGRVTTAFGVGRRIDGMAEPRHQGVDLAGPKGSPVRAANRGIVGLVSPLYESGLTVVLLHGAGLLTTYGHLSEADVAVGDTVERGQILGYIGATGRATGPHLHWGAFYGAITVDPFSLLAFRNLP